MHFRKSICSLLAAGLVAFLPLMLTVTLGVIPAYGASHGQPGPDDTTVISGPVQLAQAQSSDGTTRNPTSDAASDTDFELPNPYTLDIGGDERVLPEPFELDLRALRSPLPEPFKLKLKALRNPLPEPFELGLKATRIPLPEPSELRLKVRREQPPEPIELQLKALRSPLPAPFELKLVAQRTPLPDPSELELTLTREQLPDPFELTLDIIRGPLPEPFDLTLRVKRQMTWVIVPPVLGLDLTKAIEDTKLAGLVPKPSLGKAANRREDRPGAVHETVPGVGERVKHGSNLTLKTIGLRPKVAVPALTGMSLEEAARQLENAGLDIGKPSLGGPAPDDMHPGTVQSSIPEARTMVELFSTVRPVLHGLRQVEAAAAPDPPDMSQDGERTDRSAPPSDPVTTADGDCIPADQVKRVCYSRDGRDTLCRQNNCNMPEKREKTCQSADGRHTMCIQNGCNTVFTNADGSTFTVPCEWVETVTAAVPCYWEKVVPAGKRICEEGETPSSSRANLRRDDTTSADDSGGQQESGWAGKWDISARLGEGEMTSIIEFSDEDEGTFLTLVDVDDGTKTGHHRVRLNDEQVSVVIPFPGVGSWHVNLRREGNTCSGVFAAHTNSGIGEWRITSCRRR